MPNHNKNLIRAIAILKTEPDDYDITFEIHKLVVAGQHLSILNDDDKEVLAILMSNDEFGFAVSWQEQVMAELRVMQSVWDDEEDKLKQEAAA